MSLLQVVQHVSGNYVPIFRSRRLRSVIVMCWYCAVTMNGIIQICMSVWVDISTHTDRQTDHSLLQHNTNTWWKTTQSSAPEDGHIVARNVLSNLQKWHLVGFLSTLNYDARSATHQLYFFFVTKPLCETTLTDTLLFCRDGNPNSLTEGPTNGSNSIVFAPYQNSVALVRTRTIPTERPPPVGEVSANFCG